MASRINSSIALSALIFLNLFSLFSAQYSCLVNEYLSLGVDDLFKAATNGNRIGKCRISLNPSFCDLYVYCQYPGKSSPHGCPLDNNGQGTGCVKAPDFPQGMGHCFYSTGYDLPSSDIDSFCTEMGVDNAVAMIKWALRKGYCNLPSCAPPGVCSVGSPECKCTCPGVTGASGGPGGPTASAGAA